MPVGTRTAFVTGATGFVGLNLVGALVSEDWNVVALHRPGSDLTYLEQFPVERVVGDITDLDSFTRSIPRGVDAVFHVAGNVGYWSRQNQQQTRDNVLGTRNMVSAALTAEAKRFVHTSTISVYGFQHGAIREDWPKLGCHSQINYQRSKCMAEEAVREGVEEGLDAVILNPANIIGRFDTTGWARFILSIDAGDIKMPPPGAASFCHAGAVARTQIAAAQKGRTGENYLLGGCDATYLEMARTIGQLLDRNVWRYAYPTWLFHPTARLLEGLSIFTGSHPMITREEAALLCEEVFCDCSKAVAELDYEIVDLRTMLAESCDWLRQVGLLKVR